MKKRPRTSVRKQSATAGHCPLTRTLLTRSVLSALVLAGISNTAGGNPLGPTVVHGNATFANPGPGNLAISNSPGAIINWQSFSIGNSEITRFIQQNAGSAILNRITGGDPSKILGSLLSNGRVFLINPNGIIFGANARIDTAGLIASSLNLSDADFINSHYRFEGNSTSGDVINRGFIRVGKNGEVLLIAPTVENHGVITAENGTVLLAAGERLTISSLDLKHISFDVQAPRHTALNVGRIIVNQGAAGLFAGTVRHAGVIEANSLQANASGEVWLVAKGKTEVTGRIEAKAKQSDGGNIRILGDEVELRSARINADGANGGGEILIGGDYQGKGNVPTANNTSIDNGTTISANALNQGDGGRVIVWADNKTGVHGKISARGGPAGGDGGFVETSGKKILEFSEAVDVSAPQGQAGTWLLDPEDIDIDGGKADSIASALNQGSNVTVQTSAEGEDEGNITVSSAIEKTAGDDASLKLDAHNRIDVNAPISSTAGKLDVKLNAGRAINTRASITTNGGSVKQIITGVIDSETPLVEQGNDSAPQSDDLVEDTTSNDATPSEPTGTENAIASEPPEPGGIDAPEPDLPPKNLPDAEPEAIRPEDDPVVAIIIESDDPNPVEQQLASNELYIRPEDLPDSASTPQITIEADILTAGGDVHIDAGSEGIAFVDASLDVSNKASGQIGGTVQVLGDEVILDSRAVIDARGHSGGGQVRIGGDYQGQGELRTASRTEIRGGAEIHVDAIDKGDGGTAIIWADGLTRFYGKVTARGGENAGDGGFVEVSGKEQLIYRGEVDAGATQGDNGVLLLDPDHIRIARGGPATSGFCSVTGGVCSNASGSTGTDTILEQSLEAHNGTDVWLMADMSITLADLSASGGDGELTMQEGLKLEVKDASGTLTFDNPANTIKTTGDGNKIELLANGNSASINVGNLQTTGKQSDISITADGSNATIQVGNVHTEHTGTASTAIAGDIIISAVDGTITTKKLSAKAKSTGGEASAFASIMVTAGKTLDIVGDGSHAIQASASAANTAAAAGSYFADVTAKVELQAGDDITISNGNIKVDAQLSGNSIRSSASVGVVASLIIQACTDTGVCTATAGPADLTIGSPGNNVDIDVLASLKSTGDVQSADNDANSIVTLKASKDLILSGDIMVTADATTDASFDTNTASGGANVVLNALGGELKAQDITLRSEHQVIDEGSNPGTSNEAVSKNLLDIDAKTDVVLGNIELVATARSTGSSASSEAIASASNDLDIDAGGKVTAGTITVTTTAIAIASDSASATAVSDIDINAGGEFNVDTITVTTKATASGSSFDASASAISDVDITTGGNMNTKAVALSASANADAGSATATAMTKLKADVTGNIDIDGNVNTTASATATASSTSASAVATSSVDLDASAGIKVSGDVNTLAVANASASSYAPSASATSALNLDALGGDIEITGAVNTTASASATGSFSLSASAAASQAIDATGDLTISDGLFLAVAAVGTSTSTNTTGTIGGKKIDITASKQMTLGHTITADGTASGDDVTLRVSGGNALDISLATIAGNRDITLAADNIINGTGAVNVTAGQGIYLQPNNPGQPIEVTSGAGAGLVLDPAGLSRYSAGTVLGIGGKLPGSGTTTVNSTIVSANIVAPSLRLANNNININANIDLSGDGETLELVSGSGGATTIGAGATLTVPSFTMNGGNLVLNGTLVANGPIALNGGTVSGTGTFIGTVNAGAVSFAPGASPGTLNIIGNLNLSGASILNMEMAGTGAGQYDVIAVTGAASVNGTINLIPFGGYTPAVGDSFVMITCGVGCTGSFSTINVAGSFTVTVLTNANDVTIFIQTVVANPPGSGPVVLTVPVNVPAVIPSELLQAIMGNITQQVLALLEQDPLFWENLLPKKEPWQIATPFEGWLCDANWGQS